MMSFRSFEMSDLPKARELIADAWYGNSFSMMSPERAENVFRFYIGRHLSRCSFAEVCEIDGEFAGFIIGTAENEEPLFSKEEFPTKEVVPWWMKFSMLKIIKANGRMRAKCQDRGFDSELQLYITDKKFRGSGVGSALMERFMDYLKETGHKKMFLYTDDYCSVDYYLKRGFKEETSVMLVMVFKKHKFMVLSIEL